MSSPRRRSLVMGENANQELERYVKNLYLKAAQLIVQSRQGDKASTQSNSRPNTQTWFCLTINDIPEITLLSKSALGTISGKSLLSYPLCVEISLKTSEGDSMVLENWTLSMEDGAESKMSSNTIYNRMSLMLKSLICVSRAVPAYRLSRKQGPHSFVICYRLYVGEPSSSILGDGHKTCPVGQVVTAVGTLTLKLDYRTCMMITPSHGTNTSSETSSNLSSNMMMKSDHFDVDHPNPGSALGNNYYNKVRRCDIFGAKMSGDEFEPQGTSDESAEAMRIFATSPPDHHHQYMADKYGQHRISDESLSQERMKFGAFASKNMGSFTSDKDTSDSDQLMEFFSVDQESSPKSSKGDLTVERKLSNLSINPPESNSSREDLRRTQSDTEGRKLETQSMRPRSGSSPKSGLKFYSGAFSARLKSNEDFELLDLKTPFSAKLADPSGDLGIFFREPHLKTIKEVDSNHGNRSRNLGQDQEDEEEPARSSELEYMSANLDAQLTTYEANLVEFDEMLKNFETSELESDGV